MNIIEIKKFTEALQDINYNYDFKIIKKKDGTGSLDIPEFIMNNLKIISKEHIENV
ncbi:MAG: hypothetical protein ACYDG2_22945 [Ruminiclostridium sp.]